MSGVDAALKRSFRHFLNDLENSYQVS